MSKKPEKLTKKHLSLSFHPSVFKIMKQRKNRLMRKLKLKKLTWNDFVKIKILS